MKRKLLTSILLASLAFTVVACGNNTAANNNATEETNGIEIVEVTEAPVEEETVEVVEVPEGMYRSELTNEIISEDLKDQRPIAVMVDNEITALPHFGVADADIVYELMNSTANDRVTRLMVVMKDWADVEQLGSVRSSRSSNFYLMWEYNAIFCHDGGPFYVEPYLEKEYTDNLNGIFARFDNGKPREFTEYVTADDLDRGISNQGYSVEYNEYYEGPHFQFVDEANAITFEDDANAISATKVELPFYHNGSYLEYNEERGLYEYGEYGELHVDELNNGVPTAFTNVILQNTTFSELDENGYMVYNVLDSGLEGYYMTNGKAIPITWEKRTNTQPTRYFNAETGEEIVLNTGKTYIALVPADTWDEVVVK